MEGLSLEGPKSNRRENMSAMNKLCVAILMICSVGCQISSHKATEVRVQVDYSSQQTNYVFKVGNSRDLSLQGAVAELRLIRARDGRPIKIVVSSEVKLEFETLEMITRTFEDCGGRVDSFSGSDNAAPSGAEQEDRK
jgi:hypothetical protein